MTVMKIILGKMIIIITCTHTPTHTQRPRMSSSVLNNCTFKALVTKSNQAGCNNERIHPTDTSIHACSLPSIHPSTYACMNSITTQSCVWLPTHQSIHVNQTTCTNVGKKYKCWHARVLAEWRIEWRSLCMREQKEILGREMRGREEERDERRRRGWQQHSQQWRYGEVEWGSGSFVGLQTDDDTNFQVIFKWFSTEEKKTFLYFNMTKYCTKKF